MEDMVFENIKQETHFLLALIAGEVTHLFFSKTKNNASRLHVS